MKTPRTARLRRIAERIAVDSYRDIIAYFSPFDPTTEDAGGADGD